jgi:WD40 repeat protein
VFGWSVLGIWPPGVDGSDINTVDRSSDGQLLATGDDFGDVKLFRSPCAVEQAKFKVFSGHSSHVTTVRWTASESYEGSQFLISTGGNDRCIFVWSVI